MAVADRGREFLPCELLDRVTGLDLVELRGGLGQIGVDAEVLHVATHDRARQERGHVPPLGSLRMRPAEEHARRGRQQSGRERHALQLGRARADVRAVVVVDEAGLVDAGLWRVDARCRVRRGHGRLYGREAGLVQRREPAMGRVHPRIHRVFPGGLAPHRPRARIGSGGFALHRRRPEFAASGLPCSAAVRSADSLLVSVTEPGGGCHVACCSLSRPAFSRSVRFESLFMRRPPAPSTPWIHTRDQRREPRRRQPVRFRPARVNPATGSGTARAPRPRAPVRAPRPRCCGSRSGSRGSPSGSATACAARCGRM